MTKKKKTNHFIYSYFFRGKTNITEPIVFICLFHQIFSIGKSWCVNKKKIQKDVYDYLVPILLVGWMRVRVSYLFGFLSLTDIPYSIQVTQISVLQRRKIKSIFLTCFLQLINPLWLEKYIHLIYEFSLLKVLFRKTKQTYWFGWIVWV